MQKNVFMFFYGKKHFHYYVCCAKPNKGSISSTFFKHLLHMCRSQKRKKTDNFTVIRVLLGSARVKAACRMLMKLSKVIPQRCTINKVSYRYLCDETVNQQLFLTFVLLHGGQILAIYCTLYG